MGITIQTKTDYSFLFSGLNNANTTSNFGMDTSWLSDYASIKNGSYGKLLKAYYSETSNDSVSSLVEGRDKSSNSKTTSLTSDETKAYTEVQSATDALKESADALLEKGKDSVFSKETDAIYNAVNSFVQDYNEVLAETADVDDNSIANRISNMVNTTAMNAEKLATVGITVNEDNTLAIDKDTFMKADMEQVKDLFNTTGAFGYSTSASASLINYSADYALSKANTYTLDGTYGNNYNIGNLFNSYF